MEEWDFDWDGAPETVILRMPDRGVRAAVVALPGAGDGRARQPLFEQIGRSLSVMDVAVLSYTRRTVDEGDTPIAVQAADAIGAMRALKGRLQCPVGLFGFSQGAWAATVAAADDAAGFLVVLGCSGVSPAEQMRFYTDELLRRRGFDERDRTRSRDLRLRFEKFRRARPGAWERERLAAALRDASRESWFPYACLPDSPPPEGRGWSDMDFDPAPTFGKVRTPVLAIWGADEECVPREESRRAWLASGADVTLVDLPGCGHWPVVGSGAPEYTAREDDVVTPDLAATLASWLSGVAG